MSCPDLGSQGMQLPAPMLWNEPNRARIHSSDSSVKPSQMSHARIWV